MLMMFGQRQELAGHAVRGVMLALHTVREIRAPEDRRLLLRGSLVAEQVARTREDPARFGSGEPLRRRHRRSEGEIKVALLACARGRGGLPDQFDALPQMLRRLRVRGAAERE